jgi:hypothetical protein
MPLLTREDVWKEGKVDRFFKSRDCIPAGGKKAWISNFIVCSSSSSSKGFTKTMNDLTEAYGSLNRKLILFPMEQLG